MPDPLVHFLVPYVGKREYLEDCVESIRAQTDSRWRLSVVEDGDQGMGIRSWLRTLADERVEHLLNDQPLGIARNFQRCLDLAAAPWLVMPGYDDRLLPGYVETVLGAVHDPDVAVVQPGVEVIDELSRVVRPLTDRIKAMLRPRAGHLSGEDLATSLMHGNWTYFPSLAWRVAAIRPHGFRADLTTTLDLELLCKVVGDGHALALLDQSCFQYRRHPDSASSAAAREAGRFDEESRLYRELEHRFRELGWPRTARAARGRLTSRLHACSRLPAAMLSGDLARARRLAWYASDRRRAWGADT